MRKNISVLVLCFRKAVESKEVAVPAWPEIRRPARWEPDWLSTQPARLQVGSTSPSLVKQLQDSVPGKWSKVFPAQV